MSEQQLQCTLHYVYHDGERAEFTSSDGTIAREEIVAEGQLILILHQELRIVYSEFVAKTELYPDYRHEIDADVREQFLWTDRPCDCTNCRK
jgi:hypothetical protein